MAAHERQYFLGADAVVMRPSNDPRPRRRSCVLDLRTGKTRFEVPCELGASGHMHKRSLHIVADEGPIGRPSMLYLFGDLGVRGTWCRDRAHKVTNAIKLSAVESGLYVVILETTVAWNLPSGPWEGDAVFASLVEAGSSYLNTSDHHDVLFQLLYPDIALETGRLDADFGSEAHQQKVWESLRSRSVLATKSARVRVGRWFAWHDEPTVKAQEWSAFLLSLPVVGMRKGMWKSIWGGSPLFRKDAPVEQLVDAAAGADEVRVAAGAASSSTELAAPTTMRRSNEAVKAARAASSNSIDFVVKVLSDRSKYKATMTLVLLTAPLREEFGRRNTTDHTQMGTVSNAIDYASGSI